MKIEYLTELHTKPVARDYPAKHLGKNTDKRLLVQDFIVRVTKDDGEIVIVCVPKNYCTDGASIPVFFHRLWHPPDNGILLGSSSPRSHL